jgi:hypothetical protein
MTHFAGDENSINAVVENITDLQILSWHNQN